MTILRFQCFILIVTCVSLKDSRGISIGLWSDNVKDQFVVSVARKWISDHHGNSNYTIINMNISHMESTWASINSLLESGASKIALSSLGNRISSCMLYDVGLTVISASPYDSCSNKNYAATIGFDERFKLQITKSLIKKRKWEDVVVLCDREHSNDAEMLLRDMSNSISMHSVLIAFNENGTVDHLTSVMLKGIPQRVEAVEITIMMLTKANTLRIFMALEKELAELKGILSNVLLYEPLIDDAFEVSGDYTVVGFLIPLQSRSLKTRKEVFLHDAALVAFSLAKKVEDSRKCGPCGNTTHSCKSNLCSADIKDVISAILPTMVVPGISGKIQFYKSRKRMGIQLNLVNLKNNKFRKIGSISASGKIEFLGSIERNVKQSIFTIDISRPLLISSIRSSPFLIEERDNGIHSGRRKGFLIDVIEELSRVLQFNYTLYFGKHFEYGRIKDGKWTGIVGDVFYQNADMGLAALTITSQREEAVEFIPFMELEIVYNKQQEEDDYRGLLEFLQPFSPSAWIICFCAILLVGILIYVLEGISPSSGKEDVLKDEIHSSTETHLSGTIWFAAISSLQQSFDAAPRSFPGRTLVGFFWFMMFVVIATYTANMAAFFTSKRVHRDVKELEEFLKLNYSFSVVKTSALDQLLYYSENAVYRMIHEKIVQENTFVKSSSEGIRNTTINPKYVYIGEEPFVRKRMKPPYCQTYIVKGIMPPKSFGLPVRKNSPLRQPLAIAISKLIESGFMSQRYYYWANIYNKHKFCQNIYRQDNDNLQKNRIDILRVTGMTVALGVGLLLAVIFLPFEHFWKKKVEEKLRRVRLLLPGIGKKALVISAFEDKVKSKEKRRYIVKAEVDECGKTGLEGTSKDYLKVSEFEIANSASYEMFARNPHHALIH